MKDIEALARREKEIELMLKGAKQVLETNNFEVTARKIFDTCCELTGAKSGYVALLTEDGAENEVLFLEAGNMPCTVDPELPMPIRGLRAKSYETGRAVYHNDFMNSEHEKYMPEGHVILKNVMFSPLNIEGKTVGIIGLANKEGDFDDRDAMLAEVFGDYAAAALKNERTLDRLKESERYARSLNEILKNINLTLRHDIKNRLTFVRGMLEMMYEGVKMPSEKIKNQLEAIDYCIDLTSRMRELETLRDEKGNYMEMDILWNIKEIAGFYNVKMEYEGSGKIMADDAFRSIIDNIIANSLKHGVASRIWVKISEDESTVRIDIIDNGKGFHEEALNNAFRKGFSHGERKGSGFGLFLAKSTMERYDGLIDIGNMPEGGAYVKLIFRKRDQV